MDFFDNVALFVQDVVEAVKSIIEAIVEGAERVVRAITGWRAERLIPLLNHDDFETREAATSALIELGPGAVPVLLEAMDDEEEEIAHRAKQAAGMIFKGLGPQDGWLAESLVDELDRSEAFAEKVRPALSRLGPVVIPPLLAFLHKPNIVPMDRVEASGIIHEMGPAAVPTLIQVLEESPDENILGSAAMALINTDLGPHRENALSALEDLAADSSKPDLAREAARTAIEEIKEKE